MLGKIANFFVGPWTRCGVLMLAEYRGHPLKRLVMEFLKKPPCDEGPKKAWYDPTRSERSTQVLEKLGGIRVPAITHAGDRIDTIFISQVEVRNRIKQMGGTWTTDWLGNPIIYGPMDKPKWATFYRETLCQMGWEEITYKGQPALSTKVDKQISPKGCVFQIQSSASQMGFQKKFIGKVLAQGCDYFTFDYPGIGRSSGSPAEGRYNAAAESAFERLLALGYKKEDLIIFANCMGASGACFLKGKHPAIGRMLLDRPFGAIEPVLSGQTPIAAYGMASLLSGEPALKNYENGFRVAKWLKSSNQGKIASLYVDDDTVVNCTRDMLQKSVAKAAYKATEYVMHNPYAGKREGHTIEPLKTKEGWNAAITALSNNWLFA